ncbi:MAG: PAS domain S-box protein [Chloroflexi bacterium]|nr:PAS domain S-box protein [Chloroflexota bacterium]
MGSEAPQIGQHNLPTTPHDNRLPGAPGGRVGQFFFDSIQGTLFLLLLVLLGPVLLVQGLIYYSSFNTRLATEHRENVELARAVAATFDAYIRDVLHQQLAIGLAFTSPHPPSPAEMNRLLAESARGYPSILSYSWADSDGRVIASTGSIVTGTKITDRPYLKGILDGQDWVVSDLSLSRSAGEPRFHIATGMRDEKGLLQGVLLAEVEPTHLAEVLGLARAGQGSLSIIDRQGQLVYRYPEVDLPWEKRNVLEAEPRIAQALAGQEYSGALVLMPDERKQIAGQVPIRSIGWVAIASRPEQEAVGPVLQDLWRDVGLIILTAVLGGIAAMIISRNLTVPMRRLRRHALAIGQGELAGKVDVTGPTELEELADAFNRMASEIQASEDQREGYITELQRAERALREGEEQLTSMFETMTDGVVTFSRDGQITLVNAAAERILGLPRAEIVKRTHSNVTWKNTTVEGKPLVESDHPFVRVLRTGKPIYGFEQAFEHPDGTRLIIAISAAPLRDADGTIAGVVSLLTDITERKRAEEALRQSEQKFRSIVERSEDGIVLVDEQGLIVEWNEGQEQLSGLRKAEVLGRPLWDVQFQVASGDKKRPELYERIKGEILEALRTGRGPWLGQLVERELERSDGERRVLQSMTFPVRTEQGFMLGGISRDVTERKRAEDAQRFLAEASKQLSSSLDDETILASVAHLAVPTIADWCAVDIVPENGPPRLVASVIHDSSVEELARETYCRYCLDESGESSYAKALRTGQPVLVTEVSDSALEAAIEDADHLRAVREMGHISYIVVPITVRGDTVGIISIASMSSGRRYGAPDLAIMEDVARRCGTAIDNARLYRQAQEAIRARDEFLSVAAHELKTPVTSLRGFAQLMIHQMGNCGVVDPHRMRRALDTIDKQSDKLTRLTYHLLDVSRIEAGKLSLDRQDTDLVALVKGVAAAAQATTNVHDIGVRAPSSLPAFVDPLRIEQVVTNLIDNAIRYSPNGGPIDVELAASSLETLRMSVTDHGIGIPPEHRKSIFDRFYQAHAAHRLGGMGLGLFISRQIVNLHGGSIEAEFPIEGGTRFVVNLPVGYESAGCSADDALDDTAGAEGGGHTMAQGEGHARGDERGD